MQLRLSGTLIRSDARISEYAKRELRGLSEFTLAVFSGDTNGIPMFRDADRTIAVANAKQEVKLRAHQVIGSNEEDSVARFIAGEPESKKT